MTFGKNFTQLYHTQREKDRTLDEKQKLDIYINEKALAKMNGNVS